MRQTKGQKPLTKTCLQPKIEHFQHLTWIPNRQYISKWTFFKSTQKVKMNHFVEQSYQQWFSNFGHRWWYGMEWYVKWVLHWVDLMTICVVVSCWTLNVFKRNLKRVFDIFKWPNESWCFNYFEYFWMDSFVCIEQWDSITQKPIKTILFFQ